jgi:hypothetical protein
LFEHDVENNTLYEDAGFALAGKNPASTRRDLHATRAPPPHINIRKACAPKDNRSCEFPLGTGERFAPHEQPGVTLKLKVGLEHDAPDVGPAEGRRDNSFWLRRVEIHPQVSIRYGK